MYITNGNHQSFEPKRHYPIPRSQRGAKYSGCGKFRFSSEIAIYLRNGTR